MGGGVKAKDYASGCSSYFMQMPPTLKSFNHPISYETGDTSNTGIVINNVENISVINFNEPTIVNILNSKGVSIQDLDRVKKCNIVNSFLIFENENGSINFQEPITSKFMSGEIPSVIKINLKDIEVDANARPELNKPAIISIYNLSVNDTTIREMRGLYNNHFVPIEFANIKSYEPFTIWVNGFDICQPNPWVTGCFNDTGYLICILGPRCHHPSIDSWCPSGLGTHEILVDVISCSEGRACMNNHLCP
jgi:hypothetical protein